VSVEYVPARVPRGFVDSMKVDVTAEWSKIQAVEPWFSIYLWNDGTGDVYVSINRVVTIEDLAPIKGGKSFNVDMEGRRIRVVYLVCKPGETAAVRMWLKR